MPTITRKFEFDAGHRVWKHESKCAFLHGHRYAALVTVQAPELDSLGRVIDFGMVKALVGSWIDSNLDHNFLLHQDDFLAALWVRRDTLCTGLFGGKAPYIMPAEENPTAENIAKLIYNESQEILTKAGGNWIQKYSDGWTTTERKVPKLKVVRVRLYETPNCYADYPDLAVPID